MAGLPLVGCERDAGVHAGRRRGAAAEEQGVGWEDHLADGFRSGRFPFGELFTPSIQLKQGSFSSSQDKWHDVHTVLSEVENSAQFFVLLAR